MSDALNSAGYNEATQATTLHRLAAHAGDNARSGQVAMRQKRHGIWHEASWRDYWSMVVECAMGLDGVGIMPGERVAILSANRQEWAVSHLGIALRGAVPVGLYPSTTQASLVEQLRVTQPVAVICEDQEQLDKVQAARSTLPALRTLVVYDMRGVAAESGVIAYEDLVRIGAGRVKENPAAATALLDALTPDSIALVALSSGTTVERKPIEVTHSGMDVLLQGLLAVVNFDHKDQVLSLLPLAHPTEQMFSLVMPIAVAATVNFPESTRSMQDDIREIAPTVFVAMPRVWEGLHREIMVRRGQTGRIRRKLFDWALATAAQLARRPRAQWGVLDRLQVVLHEWIMMRALQDFVGLTRARFLGAVGAVTAPEALDFFRCIGLPLRNIYSLAEAGGLTAIGEIEEDGDTLGAILPALEHRIAAGGMLEIRRKATQRGAGVQSGEGWFESGDIVESRDGRIRLLGRSVDQIDPVNAAQARMHPSAVERFLKSSLFIREALVTPGADQRLNALVQIDFATVSEWAKLQQVSFTTFASLAANPAVAELIGGTVRELNQGLPPEQRVAGFALLQQELDTAQDELTPLLTVRRSAVLSRHAARLAAAIPV